PSGPCMTNRQTPPGRKSKACVVVVKPFGPHHWARCFGSVHTENTNARGASNTRVPTIERGACSRSMLLFSATSFLPFVLRLNCPQIVTKAIQPLLPKPAILLKPGIGFFERPHVDATGAHLRVAGARNETRALQYFQVLRNRRQRHVERLRELQHRSLAEREPRKDCAPRGVGQCREGGTQAVRGHLYLAY